MQIGVQTLDFGSFSNAPKAHEVKEQRNIIFKYRITFLQI